MKCACFVVVASIPFAACGGDDPAAAVGTDTATPVADAPAAHGGRNANADDARAIAVAFALPRLVGAGVMSSRSMVAEAVYFACAQSGAAWTGQVTTTGTIALSQLGAEYSPQPTDKLVVRSPSEVHEFEGIDAAGNSGADTAITWLQSPHRLRYLHRIPGKAEARIDEQFDGMTFTVAVTGWAQPAGERYEVALQAQGRTQGGGDLDGRQDETAYDLTGTVKGKGFTVDVRERHTSSYASAVSLRLLHSQRGWASQFRAAIGSTVTSGGAAWRFQEVQVETGAKEKGGQQTSDVVSTSGVILRDDQPYAQVTLQNGIAVAVAGGSAFPLSLPGGN